MEITIQFIINTFLSICGALVYLVINNFKSRINTIDNEIKDIKREYHKKSESKALLDMIDLRFNNHIEIVQQKFESIEALIQLKNKMDEERFNAILKQKKP